MLSSSTCHVYARDYFDQEWQSACDSLEATDQIAHQRLMHIGWLRHDLLSILDESSDRPVSELAPTIRRLLMEQDFVDENGDSVIDDDELAALEFEVKLIVSVLERVRSRCRGVGGWSAAPATPQMFG